MTTKPGSVMEKRISAVNDVVHRNNVLYLIWRDQRIHDNYCVELGYKLSYQSESSFYVAADTKRMKMNSLQVSFATEGFREMENECKVYNIPFEIVDDTIAYIGKRNVDCVILDYSPLREYAAYASEVEAHCRRKKMALFVCDTHNIVPCRLLKDYKKSAKAVKVQLLSYLRQYLREHKKLERHKHNDNKEVLQIKNKFPKCVNASKFRGGYAAGMENVQKFFSGGFCTYAKNRTNAEVDGLSNLSPWIHSGQISAQRVVLLASEKFKQGNENLDEFISEIFIWKETAEHFCLHEKNYDNINGALPWAKQTLNDHRHDKRDMLYTLEAMRDGKTSVDLWNAAQKEMRLTGKMHGRCRMYWAKQILKWTKTPEKAIETAAYLNDEYSIDGNDPSGYLGVMWSICGSMDQGFKEREVIGKIRPMNAFKSPKYIKMWAHKDV